MLSHPTLDQLHALGLHGVAKGFVEAAASADSDGLSHAEWLAILLDRESEAKTAGCEANENERCRTGRRPFSARSSALPRRLGEHVEELAC